MSKTKRAYMQGEERREVHKMVRLSKSEAALLEALAKKEGKSESELGRMAMLRVLADLQSTAARVEGDEIINSQTSLFEAMTKQMEAGQPA